MALLDKKEIETAEKITHEFFEKLGVEAPIKIEEKDEGAVDVLLEGEDLGLLIGYHGETLESLQLLLSLVLNKQLGSTDEWISVSLDVGGWREQRQEILKDMAEEAVNRLEQSGKEVHLSPMSPSQRRFVHLFLQNFPQVETHSEGDGSVRHIVINKKG